MFRPVAVFDDEAAAELSKLVGEEVKTLRRLVYGVVPETDILERVLEIRTGRGTLCLTSAPDGFRLELDYGPYKDPFSSPVIYGRYDPAVGGGTSYMYGPDEWEESTALLGQLVGSVRIVREERGYVVGVDLAIGHFVLGCRVFDDEFYITLKREGAIEELARWGAYPEAPLPD
jgi:hypothetical protein